MASALASRAFTTDIATDHPRAADVFLGGSQAAGTLAVGFDEDDGVQLVLKMLDRVEKAILQYQNQ